MLWGVLNMDYFVSTSLSKLEKMIEKEKDAAMRLSTLKGGVSFNVVRG